MTNPIRRKPIMVTLSDGIQREIKFTLNAMADLEEKYGSVDAAFKALETGSIAGVRYFLYCTLQQNKGENLSEREIGDLIDMPSMGDLMQAIEQATGQDMPTDEDVSVEGEASEVSPN